MDFSVGRVSTSLRYDLGEAMKKTVQNCFRPDAEYDGCSSYSRSEGDEPNYSGVFDDSVYPEYRPKIETLMSERNKPLILLDGYKYILRHTQRDGSQRWVCSDYGCRSYVKLEPIQKRIVERRTWHDHEKPDPRKIARQKISYCLKKAAVYDLDSKAANLLATEILPSELSALSPKDIGNIRKNISYARRKARQQQEEKLPDLSYLLLSGNDSQLTPTKYFYRFHCSRLLSQVMQPIIL